MKKIPLILIIGLLIIISSLIYPVVNGYSSTQNFNYKNIINNKFHLTSKIYTLNLKPGDIVWRWSYIPLITHCMLFVGINEDNKYAFIEANSMENVWMPEYDIDWVNSELFDLVARVNTTPTKIDGALEFAKEQVGKKFEYIHEKEFNPDTEYWYCTELIWASFYSQGVDIDYNGWEDNFYFNYPVIMPFEIYFDDDVDVYKLFNT